MTAKLVMYLKFGEDTVTLLQPQGIDQKTSDVYYMVGLVR
ncbi:hypothetical protein SAMN04489735_101071 [Aneurinibacillus thermoaerophilus]|uniref:Uncharacterized protein n=1 Tax=Aneurinibacillus thermoaerophilus TaxID=143495 RepID=A0A1G7ZFL0_ANETH|nr:hypothetical protein SAMN04489735_101071 [Aneurinibacillus thermoaerophilus]